MRFDVMPVKTERQILEVEKTANKVWHNYYKDILSPEQIDYMLEKYQSKEALYRQLDEGYIYYMLMVDGEIAGYMCMIFKEDCISLTRLYIKAEFRRMGLARRSVSFLDSLFSSSREFYQNIDRIELRVERKNEFAINIYEHLGFKKVRSVDIDIGGGFFCNDYVMERPLSRISDNKETVSDGK